MHAFRKKPVYVQAKRMDKEFKVSTLEGEMIGKAGDWLIKGVMGEFYPCRDDIFRETYEPCGQFAEEEFCMHRWAKRQPAVNQAEAEENEAD